MLDAPCAEPLVEGAAVRDVVGSARAVLFGVLDAVVVIVVVVVMVVEVVFVVIFVEEAIAAGSNSGAEERVRVWWLSSFRCGDRRENV